MTEQEKGILDTLSRIDERTINMNFTLARLEKMVNDHTEAIHGGSDPGILERLRSIEVRHKTHKYLNLSIITGISIIILQDAWEWIKAHVH